MSSTDELYRLRTAINETYRDLRALALDGGKTFDGLGIVTHIRVDAERLFAIQARLNPLLTFGAALPSDVPPGGEGE